MGKSKTVKAEKRASEDRTKAPCSKK